MFPEPPVVAFRQPKSIKDTLVRAAVSKPSSTVGQCKPCGDKRCKCCLQLQHTQVFHSKTTGKEYKIFCNVNCKTPNVVYLLDCHVCGSQYVGESVQPFNKRMNGHRSDLTKKTLLPMSQQFVSPGHSLDDFGRSKIYIIDHNPSWKENQRQKRESFWIRELQTLHPEGINNQRLPGACNRSPGSKLLSITMQLHCGGHLGGRERLPDTILEEDHPMTIPSKFGFN